MRVTAARNEELRWIDYAPGRRVGFQAGAPPLEASSSARKRLSWKLTAVNAKVFHCRLFSTMISIRATSRFPKGRGHGADACMQQNTHMWGVSTGCQILPSQNTAIHYYGLRIYCWAVARLLDLFVDLRQELLCPNFKQVDGLWDTVEGTTLNESAAATQCGGFKVKKVSSIEEIAYWKHFGWMDERLLIHLKSFNWNRKPLFQLSRHGQAGHCGQLERPSRVIPLQKTQEHEIRMGGTKLEITKEFKRNVWCTLFYRGKEIETFQGYWGERYSRNVLIRCPRQCFWWPIKSLVLKSEGLQKQKHSRALRWA